MTKTQIYLISPPHIEDINNFKHLLEGVIAADAISVFQLRLKDITNRDYVLTAKQIFPMLQEAGIACIINDNANVARDTKADGVHLGQEDGYVAEARAILGKDRIIGRTCHNSRHLAMIAAEEGVDYVAFGAFYPTTTKEVKYHAEPELLDWWQDLMEIPCVAIGGINAQNALPIINAGADFIAVSSAVWSHKDGVEVALKELKQICEG